MKNKSIICLILVLGLSLFVSCSTIIIENPKGGDFVFSDHFISWYYKMNALDLFTDTSFKVEDSVYGFICQSSFSEYWTKEHNPEGYTQFCEKYGDSAFKAYQETYNQASVNDFSGISITSGSDFPGHPAGTELNDICFIRLLSAKPFLDSGYSDSFLESDHVMIDNYRLLSSGEGYTVICKPVNEVSKEDLMLIARNFHIGFLDKPVEENSVTYITVTLKQEGESPIIGTVGVNFSND